MEFNKTDKMAFLLQTNYHLVPVFHRFGFQLGFGNKTVEQLCNENEINTDFFLAIVNTFHNRNTISAGPGD
jgi:regulator of cell morphogenesis and NO signaling